MKTTRLYTAILSLMVPALVFSLGLGEIKLESSLNQPFKAEIPLLDAEGIPINGIKVNLASLEEFERVGIPLDDVLSLFKFVVKRNTRGHPVIEISSEDRVTEPFLQILVDLAWANGQLYRSYTVLLDPPGYKLVTPVKPLKKTSAWHSSAQIQYGSEAIHKEIDEEEKKQPAAVKNHRKEATYGPTLGGESIWQIAQHYSTPDTSLQQVILAIVGTNSQAFTQGNLNGLKMGERLRIPANEEVLRVPAVLAKQEVEAHDEAWKTRQEIKHVLLPPYINGETGVSQFGKTTDLGTGIANSEVAEAPAVTSGLQSPIVSSETPASMMSVVPPATDNLVKNRLLSYIPPVAPLGVINKETRVSDVGQSTVSPGENSGIKQQMTDLVLKNNALEKEVEHQNEEFKALRQQIQSFTKGSAVPQVQPTEPIPGTSSNLWMYLLFLMGATGLGYWFWAKYYGKDRPTKPVKQPNAPQLSPKESGTDVSLGKSAPVIISMSDDKTETPVLLPEELTEVVEETSVTAPMADRNDTPSEVLAEDSVALTEEKPVITPVPEMSDNPPDVTATESVVTEEEVPAFTFEADMSDTAPGASQEEQVIPTATDVSVKLEPDSEENKNSSESQNLVDFEPGLDKLLISNETPEEAEAVITEADEITPVEHDTTPSPDEIPADFNEVAEKSDPTSQTTPKRLKRKTPKVAKSKAALDTLLGLARTYVSMEDYITARQSLDEVLKFGSDSQKLEAQTLIDEIRDK